MNHRRTTPKVFAHAHLPWRAVPGKELRRELTPLERKLWARLRAHRMKDVHFRAQHAIGNYVVDFCAARRKLIIELDGTSFGRNIWNKQNTMPKGRASLNQKATK